MTTETLANRQIAIEVAYNVRHLGGYRTRDGRETSARIIRAASLHRLTDTGIAQLDALGVRTVVDLRAGKELEAQVTPDLAGRGIRHVHAPVFQSDASPVALNDGFPGFGPVYERFLELGSPAFRLLFEEIVATEGAVLFHCAAGKDRTGVAAALLLELAGVPDEDIVRDYALSASLIVDAFKDWKSADGQAAVAKIDEPTRKRLLGSEPEDMEATLGHIRSRWGGAEGYIEHIGLDRLTIRELRQKLIA